MTSSKWPKSNQLTLLVFLGVKPTHFIRFPLLVWAGGLGIWKTLVLVGGRWETSGVSPAGSKPRGKPTDGLRLLALSLRPARVSPGAQLEAEIARFCVRSGGWARGVCGMAAWAWFWAGWGGVWAVWWSGGLGGLGRFGAVWGGLGGFGGVWGGVIGGVGSGFAQGLGGRVGSWVLKFEVCCTFQAVNLRMSYYRFVLDFRRPALDSVRWIWGWVDGDEMGVSHQSETTFHILSFHLLASCLRFHMVNPVFP